MSDQHTLNAHPRAARHVFRRGAAGDPSDDRSQASFGFVPLAAGQSGVSGVGPDNDQIGVSFDAQ
jgi:hypothetical protein